MKKIKNIIRSAFVAIVLGCSSMMTSCIDYLTMYPTDAIILENYWKTTEDVEAMVAACYGSLVNSGVIERLMIWGELRGDNMTVPSGSSNSLSYIVESNLLESNSYFMWDNFYKTINYCNLVLKYGYRVMEEDPDFTQGDFDVIRGEMYALRALCHFILVRSFRDVPMSFIAVDSDDQLMAYPQYSPYEALDSIYTDLKRAESLCMASGGWPKSLDGRNYMRITKNAVYAMLADVSLWRAAFAQYSIVTNDEVKYLNDETARTYTDADVKQYFTDAINASDSVITDMNDQVRKKYKEEKLSLVALDTVNNPYMLSLNNTKEYMKAYDQIFLEKDTREGDYLAPNEIIFKLEFTSTNTNSAIKNYYGYNDNSYTFIVPSSAPIAMTGDGNDGSGLWNEEDLRYSAYTTAASSGADASTGSFNKKVIRITKYNTQTAKKDEGKVKWIDGDRFDVDWIFYRKTDVMLMKALAHAYRNDESQNDLTEAFNLVYEVNKRCMKSEKGYMSKETTLNQEQIVSLVYKERLRELAFEGKRWYDLVMMAHFQGNTDKVVEYVMPKLDGASSAASTKMSNMYSLFCPIHKDELISNPLLKQNPVFKTNDSFQKN